MEHYPLNFDKNTSNDIDDDLAILDNDEMDTEQTLSNQREGNEEIDQERVRILKPNTNSDLIEQINWKLNIPHNVENKDNQDDSETDIEITYESRTGQKRSIGLNEKEFVATKYKHYLRTQIGHTRKFPHDKSPYRVINDYSYIKNPVGSGVDFGNVCYDCGFVSITLNGFRKHKEAHARGYKCSFCTEVFLTTYGYSHHVNLHQEGTIREIDDYCECRLCNGSFITIAYLEIHLFELHGENALFNKNNMQLNPTSKLEDTSNEPEESTENMFRCGVCNSYFTYSLNLDCHMALHNKESFACGKCDSNFISLDPLLEHISIHKHLEPQKIKVTKLLPKGVPYKKSTLGMSNDNRNVPKIMLPPRNKTSQNGNKENNLNQYESARLVDSLFTSPIDNNQVKSNQNETNLNTSIANSNRLESPFHYIFIPLSNNEKGNMWEHNSSQTTMAKQKSSNGLFGGVNSNSNINKDELNCEVNFEESSAQESEEEVFLISENMIQPENY